MRAVVAIGVLGVAAVAAAAVLHGADPGKSVSAATAERITVVPGSKPASARSLPSVAPAAMAQAPRRASWRPALSDTWQWQLSGAIDTGYDVKVYDIDLFDAPDAVLNQLHAAGRRVVCYFSAGSSENWRPDFDRFRAADQGKPLDHWPGERWLDVRSKNVRRIMTARLDLAATRGCDGVEPDNVDGYANRTGLDFTADDQLAYNRFLAEGAHSRGLAVALKNDLGQVKALEPAFDFAVNEQCHQYRECDKLKPFTAAGKPVFNAEYKTKYRDNVDGARDQLCRAARAENVRTLVLPLKLNDAYRYSCD